MLWEWYLVAILSDLYDNYSYNTNEFTNIKMTIKKVNYSINPQTFIIYSFFFFFFFSSHNIRNCHSHYIHLHPDFINFFNSLLEIQLRLFYIIAMLCWMCILFHSFLYQKYKVASCVMLFILKHDDLMVHWIYLFELLYQATFFLKNNSKY